LKFIKEITICHNGGHSYKINYKRVILFHRSRWNLLRKHKLISAPSVARSAIKLRIYLEVIVFKLLLLINPAKKDYEEKIKGRKLIMQEINTFG
jgi:hypothetical protein